jgi:hypothetical protein
MRSKISLTGTSITEAQEEFFSIIDFPPDDPIHAARIWDMKMENEQDPNFICTCHRFITVISWPIFK